MTTTFGVHFYDKPLKGEFPIILAGANNIPVYPKVSLGGDDVIGWYYTIKRVYCTAYVSKYNSDSDMIAANTVVYYTADEYTDGRFVKVNIANQQYNGFVFYKQELLSDTLEKVVVNGLDNNGQTLREYTTEYRLYPTNSIIYAGTTYYEYNRVNKEYIAYVADEDIRVMPGDEYFYKVETFNRYYRMVADATSISRNCTRFKFGNDYYERRND